MLRALHPAYRASLCMGTPGARSQGYDEGHDWYGQNRCGVRKIAVRRRWCFSTLSCFSRPRYPVRGGTVPGPGLDVKWSPTGKPVAPAPTPAWGRTSRPVGTANGAHGQGRGPKAGLITQAWPLNSLPFADVFRTWLTLPPWEREPAFKPLCRYAVTRIG